MEDNFLKFLDSLGLPIGTWIGIILGAVALIGGIVVALRKAKKKYDDNLQKRLEKEEVEEAFRKSMAEVASNVSIIQTDINTIKEEYAAIQQEIQDKLETVWNAIADGEKNSRIGDKNLFQQLESHERAMDKLAMQLSAMDEKTNLLIESDKEGIKSYIVEKYYETKRQGYIEINTLETLEERYKKYLEENGNTYIKNLMDKMRIMPAEPPSQSEDL